MILGAGRFAFAQDTLIVTTQLGSYKIENRNLERLKLGYVIKSSKDVPEALKYFRRARWLQAGGMLFGVPGGFILGYQIGYYVSTQKLLEKEVLLTGLGLYTVSHTFSLLRNRAIKKGAIAYNQFRAEQRKNYDNQTP